MFYWDFKPCTTLKINFHFVTKQRSTHRESFKQKTVKLLLFFLPCFAYCKQDNLDVPFHRWKADNCISVSFTSGSRSSCEHFRLVTEQDEESAAPPAALPIEVSSQRALKGLMFTERNDGLCESIRITHSRAQPHINFRSVTFVFENNMHSKAIIYPALKEYYLTND